MSLTYTTRRETALARVSAYYVDTPVEALGRAVRKAQPHKPRPPARWPKILLGTGEPPVVTEHAIDVKLASTTYADTTRRGVARLAEREVERMTRASGITVDGRRVYPFGVRVEHGTEVTERRPEVGWSSDGTHTPPRFNTRRWWA